VKLIGVEEINAAYEDLDNGNKSGHRHVIDISTLNESAFEKCKVFKTADLSIYLYCN